MLITAVTVAIVCLVSCGAEVKSAGELSQTSSPDDEGEIAGLGSLFLAEERDPYHHNIIQRQSCDPNSVEQNRRVAAAKCDTNYVTAIVSSPCNFLFTSLGDIRRCGTDRGTLCALYDPSLDTREIRRLCFVDNTLPETLANCSSKCRKRLETFASEFGCCIHTEPRIVEAFSNTLTPLLWSQCGVTRPEPCEDTPNIPEKSTDDPSCSSFCGSSQSFGLECQHIGDKLLQIYEQCGDTVSANELRQRCGFNARGRFCGIIPDFTASLTDTIFPVYNKCYNFLSSGQCATACKEALEDLKETYGCCVNNLNSTSQSRQREIGVFVTSYKLWSACGVESPGFCSLPADLSVYDELIQCNACRD